MPWRSITAVALLALALAGGALAAWVARVAASAPGEAELRALRLPQPSVLVSADGQTLATLRRVHLQPLPLDRMGPLLPSALVATEDRRFAEHDGIDWRRTVSAALHTATGDVQGGSTITQQLARNLFPKEIGRARSLERKVKEMVTARRIERLWTKEQILERYLNSVPFLYNVMGVEMAARTYFGRGAEELDTAQVATLVGMLKGTHYYNPVLHPQRARERRNVVLLQMARHGLIEDGALRALQARPMAVSLQRPRDGDGGAPHFAVLVRRWLNAWAEARGLDPAADGLVVQTTLDSRLQRAAESALAGQARLLQDVAAVEWSRARPPFSTDPQAYAAWARRAAGFDWFWQQRPQLLDEALRQSGAYREARQQGLDEAAALGHLRQDARAVARAKADFTRLEAGFVAVEPGTGAVRAWVGSRDFGEDQFDHVAQAQRQPGSTFKPFVYGAALEAGLTPDRGFVDEPVEIRLADGNAWRPTDMGGPSYRWMTLREGLAQSKNTITAQAMMAAGLPRVVQVARAAGVQSRLDAVPSLALGTSPVTLLEMVGAYATLATEGQRRTPWFIQQVSDRHGQVLAAYAPPDAVQALARETANDLIEMLRGPVRSGTATAIRSRYGINADVAGKTGTTQRNTDGWFILMHRDLVAGAWVGFNDQRVTMRSDHWGQGGHGALRIVGEFTREALKQGWLDAKATLPPPLRPPAPPPRPEDDLLEVDPGHPPPEAGPPLWSGASPGMAPTVPAGVIVQRVGGSTAIGDAAGMQSLRGQDAPPKTERELEQALGPVRPATPAPLATPGLGLN
ncbi:transglycosylase domain-containing protein [Aquabacterium sp. J223]|uniref:transglycosylase domain-containing protein n=1 Tax=Aquabacterium sp. J223 TaxID=2898431 RepID=UPI0021AE086C|nr:transglycosylase domain-containing protein [Aquabacterium sp. J223]UUX94310.1 transglycosylase domain-containing protein [Aquabacterium sp. J223]